MAEGGNRNRTYRLKIVKRLRDQGKPLGGQILSHLADGKKHSRNVCGHTEAECEEKLKELILQMKAEIAALRSGEATEYRTASAPRRRLSRYLREHPARPARA